MRTFLCIVVLLLVVVVCLGFYLEWFSFSTSRDPDTGRVGGQISIDKDKMKSDLQKAKDKLTHPGGQAKEQPEGN